LQEPYELPYLGDGENKVPTIHISDLVKLVIKVAESPCEQPYVFGIDNSPDRRQISIVKGISDGVGSGRIISTEATPLIKEEY
jgi:adenylate kinase